MMFPIRCFSCGAPIADKWEKYVEAIESGEEPGKVLDSLGITRYCCRRMFLSHVEYFDEIVQFESWFGKSR